MIPRVGCGSCVADRVLSSDSKSWLRHVAGRPARRPASPSAILTPHRIVVGDCVAEMAKLPAAKASISSSPIRPITCSSQGDLKRPDNSQVDAVDDDWDKFSSFAAYDAFTRAWLIGLPPGDEADRDALGHRLLPQHLPRRRDLQDLGFWILNDVVWRKSNPMPNFRGRRFTNAHETLIWAAREPDAQGLHVQLRGAEGRQRGCADALRLDASALHRRRAAEGPRRQEAAPDPEARGAAGARRSWPPRARRPGPRSVLRHRHHRRGRQAPGPPLHRHRARSGLRGGGRAAHRRGRAAASADRWRRSWPRARRRACRSRRWSKRGLVAPGEMLFDAKRRVTALVRADGALALGDASARSTRSAPWRRGSACNGWTFWHVETAKGLAPIDALRAEVRATMARPSAVASSKPSIHR